MNEDLIREMPRGWVTDHARHPQTTGVWSSTEPNGIGGGKIVLGGIDSDFCGYDDDRHFITFAGSRAGKGVSLIIPTLLTYQGSVLAIDPKGELATITASRRGDGSDYSEGMGGKVYVLDPFKRVEGNAVKYRASFNPLATLDPETDDGLQRATMIADGLVVQAQGDGSHFTAAARSLLRGLILYVCRTEVGESRSLIRVRELISQPEKDFEHMLKHMGEMGGTIGRAATSLQLKAPNERASVVSTADVQTDFLEDGAMRECLSGHDFDLEDLKDGLVTVYLSLPAGRLATHGRWLRLMVGLSLEAMEATGPIKDEQNPVLFVLDEFAALGTMTSLEKAAGQIAGFGVKLWPILQDITQLKRDYKESWETFIGNAGMITAFGVSDVSTTEYLSKILGKTLIQSFSSSTSGGSLPNTNSSLSWQVANLLDPHEVSRYFGRDTWRILCIEQGDAPFLMERCAYYRDFIGFYDPAPGRKPPPKLTEIEKYSSPQDENPDLEQAYKAQEEDARKWLAENEG